MVKYLVFLFLFGYIAFAQYASMADVCKELKLIPASKAIVQWERIFSSESRKEKYHINQLTAEEQKSLKAYLIQHAADSNQPMVPGL